jgi:hypothetical protein
MRRQVRATIAATCCLLGCTPQLGISDHGITYSFVNRCATAIVVSLGGLKPYVPLALDEQSSIGTLDQKITEARFSVTLADGSGEKRFQVDTASFSIEGDRCP